MSVVIDANVFVAATRLDEPHYAASLGFLETIRNAQVSLHAPILVLAECAAALTRRTGDLGRELVQRVRSFGNITLATIDQTLGDRAAELAPRHRLRAADAIYFGRGGRIRRHLGDLGSRGA